MEKIAIIQCALSVFSLLVDYVVIVRPILQTLSPWLLGAIDALVSVGIVTPTLYPIVKRLNHK